MLMMMMNIIIIIIIIIVCRVVPGGLSTSIGALTLVDLAGTEKDPDVI